VLQLGSLRDIRPGEAVMVRERVVEEEALK